MFNGQLNHNEVYQAIYNMIISQVIFADNIYETKSTLADLSRINGGLYGDTKLFYATDTLKSYAWTGDEEAGNLLKLHRPQPPKCQPVTVDKFRIIPCTTDQYLTKRAFSTEGAFSMFNSQILGWVRDTKRIYDATLFNSFVGTHVAGLEDSGKGAMQNVQIIVPAEPDGVDDYNTESYNRIVAQTIATDFANLIVNLLDITRNYNDYGYIRSWNPDDLVYVWNADWVNKITKLDTPTIFNASGLFDKDKFGQHTLPARYFGNVNSSGGTTSGTNTTIRSLVEVDYNVVDMGKPGYDESKHIFPGDLLPPNTPYEANETYTEDHTLIFKIYHKDSIPFMTAFETGSEFWNPRSLTSTNYLIWGYNTLTHLKNYPFITGKIVQAG